MKMKSFALLAGAVLLTACTQSQQAQTKTQANDALILAQIRTKITALDAATLSTVHLSVNNGRVALSGEVPNAGERTQIADAARTVSGVASVDDRIRVNPRAKTAAQITNDLELAAKVNGAIAAQTGINAFQISVKTDRGVVSLTGTVPTVAMHSTVLSAVKGVHGVRAVIDRIRIQR